MALENKNKSPFFFLFSAKNKNIFKNKKLLFISFSFVRIIRILAVILFGKPQFVHFGRNISTILVPDFCIYI